MSEDQIGCADGYSRRVLLLLTNHTYRAQSFMDSAERLGIEVIQAIDMPKKLANYWDVALGIDFTDLDQATGAIVAYAEAYPLDAIISVDDSGSMLAARASKELGLPHNSFDSAEAARNKFRMRQLLCQAGVSSPVFQRYSTEDDPLTIAGEVSYPCVVKPLLLSGSRGVIRANDAQELIRAIERLARMLERSSSGPHDFLVEQFIPGIEVALEGMLDEGKLILLALFDKPDPLDGPFFEETIYVTPSRLPEEVQAAIADCTGEAAQALGLRTGPIHAELRINEAGPWIVEVAGRSIGGLCSQTLRFGSDSSLEELILRQACGLEISSTRRENRAGGVMMIPIPQAGFLKKIEGIQTAEAVPLIESVEITAKLNYPITPLPEGESYLGFIFARGDSPEAVEAALRQAHDQLHFEISPMIPLEMK